MCKHTWLFAFEQEPAGTALCHLLVLLQGRSPQLRLAAPYSFSAKAAWLPWSRGKPNPQLPLPAHTNVAVASSVAGFPKRNSYEKHIYQKLSVKSTT